MKLIKIWALLPILFSLASALIGPDLQVKMDKASSSDLLPVNVILKEQADAGLLNQMFKGYPKKVRKVEVARTLQQFAQEKQKGVIDFLRPYVESQKVTSVTPLWIVNAIHCNATKDVITLLSEHPSVWFVEYDLIYSPNLLPKPVKSDITEAITWGVRKIRAPQVWALGYTGAGIIAGMIDTGVNYNHLDLRDHMWTDPNYPNHGWNFEYNNNDPIDIRGHGTHTAGTVASDGTAGTQCGVAPDCQIMALRVRTVADSVAENQVWQAMQFVISPPLSPDNGGDFISMSLGWWLSWNPRQAIWRTSCNNVGAAGIPMIVAAGNEREYQTPPNACRCPGNVPPPWWNPQNTGTGALSNVISVGALDSLDAYAYFSSPGPVTWQNVAPFNDYPYPPGLTRPDVSGPGVAVISCDYNSNNGYVPMDGTSMATPHTAGIVALMLEKNPELLPWEIDSILEVTAVDLGPAGKDNDFGAGRIDALNAINHTQLPGGVRPLRYTIIDNSPGNLDSIINPGEGIEMPVWVINRTGREIQGLRGILRLANPDPNVTVTDSVKYFGNIAAGDSAYTGADGYNFMVAAACTNAYPIPLQLICVDTLDTVWTNNLGLRVGTPVLFPGQVNVFDPPPGGNGNGKVDPGETAFVEVGIRNRGLGNGYDVTAYLISGDSRLLILDSIGTYGNILHDTIGFNTTDRFQVYAHSSIPRETQIPCTLRIIAAGYPVQTRAFAIDIGRLTATDPIPDGPRTPPLYYAYDNVDSFYVEHPTYEWVEINTIGTRLTLSDDQTVQITLPASFGPWKFYNQRYTQLSICSNGWIAPGYQTATTYLNQRIPDQTSTNPNGMVCANWDDLYPNNSGVGGVYYYHDAANHRFIIEYDSVPYWGATTIMDKFQIIIYDTTLAAADGHNEIIVNYMTANRWNSSTVGIEDPTNQIGICALFNDTLHRACAPWVPRKAIKYTTDTIAIVELTERPTKSTLTENLSLKISNPAHKIALIKFQIPKKCPVSLLVFDATGRFVANLFDSKDKSVEPGIYTIRWDGKDDSGKRVASGIYFYRLKTEDKELTKKTIFFK
ncbi:MAG: S8 family serine peptidase [candidate division WOR-3 bacterium]